MYFANEADPDLALDFTPGRYGPYSERVRHLLQGMEGAFTVGLGDGTARVLANQPISLTTKGTDAITDYLATDAAADRVSAAVDTVLRVIEGFEGPYGLSCSPVRIGWPHVRAPRNQPRQRPRSESGQNARVGSTATIASVLPSTAFL